METCHTCGNHYEKLFTVIKDEVTYKFDCFECAIHALAPICASCGIKIIGHGFENANAIYCCHHCLKHAGLEQAAVGAITS